MVSSVLKTKLLPHQEQTVSLLLSKKCIGDWSTMGTGKSLSAIASICATGKKAVVVCPPFLVENWVNEVKKHSTLTVSPHFIKWDKSDVTIVPYTQLEKAEDVFKNTSFLVADESQYLKNLNAKRTQRFHYLFYKYIPEYFMLLSGTPLKNRIPEMYSFLLLWDKWGVKPAITEKYKSFYTFCCRFTNVVQGKYGMSYGGMKNVEELRTYIKGHSIKHEASVLDLPELSESQVVVSYKENPLLDKAFKEFSGSRFSAEITVKVESAASKAVFTSNFVSDAVESGEGPVVVFSDHRKPIEIMELELSKLRTRSITGEIPPEKRQGIVDMFNNGQLDVLLCTFGAASTGINLTSSNLMVINDLPWEVASLEQAKKRSHRLGQSRPCRIVHVIGSSVDDLILKTLNSKMKVINSVMG
jgi:SWI/SNF-related matrix-associated actin-dependent regulator 1 of chromatin subfamily A